jgi:hypothetical protein
MKRSDPIDIPQTAAQRAARKEKEEATAKMAEHLSERTWKMYHNITNDRKKKFPKGLPKSEPIP